MPNGRQPRLMVFVIAYYAEETLTRVLERIPRSIFSDYDCEVLVVDDASGDRTAEIGREYRRTHPEIAITVLRNQYNQGYGGNQKVGYAFAMLGTDPNRIAQAQPISVEKTGLSCVAFGLVSDDHDGRSFGAQPAANSLRNGASDV